MTDNQTSGSELAGSTQSDRTAAESLDILFDTLANRRRRHVIHCLKEHGTPLALADVADEVATMESDSPITETSPEEVKRIYVSLYHTHVPKREDAGVVRYSQERYLVALVDEHDRLDEYESFLS